jgi:membrane associated rhomboid family serine protease
MRQPRTAYGGKVTARPGTVSMLLIAVNMAVFVLTALGGAGLTIGGGTSAVYRNFAMYPPAIASGEYYRLLTSMFLHFGLLHIAFNMYALFLLGPQVETALGRWRFGGLYLLAGLGGSAASYLFSPVNVLGAGASGAIFGLFAAYFLIARRAGADTGQIMALIGVNLVLGFVLPGVDYRAHLGGLIVGALATAVLVHAPAGRSRAAVQTVGLVAVALLVVGAVLLRTVQLS